jgi:antitoxin (DNA-binding transcriptional repressor) of toxin-antitoxin stability system
MAKQYKAGEFKAKCLKILDDVLRERETVYVTKRGRLVAAVIPPPDEAAAAPRGLEGSVVFQDDLVSPIDEPWEADR